MPKLGNDLAKTRPRRVILQQGLRRDPGLGEQVAGRRAPVNCLHVEKGALSTDHISSFEPRRPMRLASDELPIQTHATKTFG